VPPRNRLLIAAATLRRGCAAFALKEKKDNQEGQQSRSPREESRSGSARFVLLKSHTLHVKIAPDQISMSKAKNENVRNSP
jgi:hypothetical protein